MKRMLRIVIDDLEQHQTLRCVVGYVTMTYRILPEIADLEGAVYCVDEKLCEAIKRDVGQRYPELQITCEEPWACD